MSVTGIPRSGKFPAFWNLTLKARSAATSTVVGVEGDSVFDWPLETASVLSSTLPWRPPAVPLPLPVPLLAERRPP